MDVKKVLIIGSGALKIGEAGEFDYSGAQAIKALKEEGIEVVLINPNIATVQTDERFTKKVYSIPINARFIEKVIEKERPDGILLGFGGQTALNAGMELHEKGILEKYGVNILGTGAESIRKASNRDDFRKLMLDNNVQIPKSEKATSTEEAKDAAARIGYPVMVRVAYTLGGQGTGVARNDAELEEIASKGLAYSRIKQILIEEYLEGWKEVEYEVMRDSNDNCIIICNMENFDPMGIHTGESIVVAPSQTLTNKEYHELRSTGFKVIRALGIIGECNIQYALNPDTGEYRVIEVNSRLSRSSALASKATGYPIAYIAAKLSVGRTLPELQNKVTGVTTACFEPSLDYVVVKMPRWDFQKFRRVKERIGTQMKSVGEIMAIGRNFEEALQKAVRMLDVGRELTDEKNSDNILKDLSEPTDKRIFYIVQALKSGIGADEISRLTGIGKWFLHKINNIIELEKKMGKEAIGATLLEAKRLGFSDAKIASIYGTEEDAVRAARKKLGIIPKVKQIDTLAGEWPAQTNYLYMTYWGEDDIDFGEKKKVIVLGSGCYRIGSSVEFDWCCVNMGLAMKKFADEVIMINYNPETVSTDYDVLDKLYFEELTLERVLDIMEKENPHGIVVSVGGQIPNGIALKLAERGANILGTEAGNIDKAEDRYKFSSLLDELGIKQPEWNKFESVDRGREFARKIGYPVLIRPSYVLSGSAMAVVFNDDEMEHYLKHAANVSRDHPVVISKFMLEAREIEVDGVCDGKNVFIGAIMEHVENAGVHSGDATMSIPTFSVTDNVKEKIRNATRKIAAGLGIKGPFNIQYIAKNEEIYVIECNLRASRSMPFVSKTAGINLMQLAAEAIMGGEIEDAEAVPKKICVKSPQFSFMRLEGADPVTGVEMVSTGEVACFGETFEEAFLKSSMASGMNIPEDGKPVLITVGSDKEKIIQVARKLSKKYRILATEHTAQALTENGISCSLIYKIGEQKQPNILDYLVNKNIGMVINIPNINGAAGSEGMERTRKVLEDEYLIRRKAVEFGVPVITNMELLEALTSAIYYGGIEKLTERI